MIRDYRDYVAQRWYALDMPAKIKAAADDEAAQKPIQCAWLIRVAGELAQTTAFEGREHPDVGLYFKDVGNFYDAGGGLKIATDILCVCDTDGNGNVTDPQKFAVIDVNISSLRHAAHPGWIVQGMGVGPDRVRFRRPPEPDARPADDHESTVRAEVRGAYLRVLKREPDAEGWDHWTREMLDNGLSITQVEDRLKTDPAYQPDVEQPPVKVDVGLGFVTVPEVVEQLKALVAEAQKQTAVLEGIRRDVDNGGKLLAQLAAGGGPGGLLSGLWKPKRNEGG